MKKQVGGKCGAKNGEREGGTRMGVLMRFLGGGQKDNGGAAFLL